ncbi:MAG: hypothetical protein ACLUW6_01800 [Coriobacteriaceae bacterium]
MARILYGKEVSSALWERLLPASTACGRTAWRRRSPLCAGERPDDLSYERTCARQAISMALPCAASCCRDATQAELEPSSTS